MTYVVTSFGAIKLTQSRASFSSIRPPPKLTSSVLVGVGVVTMSLMMRKRPEMEEIQDFLHIL